MQFIVGKVVIVGKNEVVHKENYQFSSVILVIKKRMDGKVRNIAFDCFGKVADEVLKFKKDDKVAITYYITSNCKNEKWYVNLKEKEVMKVEKIKKQDDNTQLNIEI